LEVLLKNNFKNISFSRITYKEHKIKTFVSDNEAWAAFNNNELKLDEQFIIDNKIYVITPLNNTDNEMVEVDLDRNNIDLGGEG